MKRPRNMLLRGGIPLLLLLASAVSSCRGESPALAPTPNSTPETLEVRLTPALLPLRTAIAACSAAYPFTVITRPEFASEPLEGSLDVLVRLGPGKGLPFEAVALAQERVEVVVNRKNPIDSLSREELRALFGGETVTWEGRTGPVTVWLPLEGDETRQIFTTDLMGGRPFSPFAMLAPSPDAMFEAVRSDPGAIGLLPAAGVNGEVKAVEIQGLQEGALARPVLAFILGDNTGARRALAGCLQSGKGQTLIAQMYDPWKP